MNATTRQSGPHRILVVDDDTLLLDFLKLVLADVGQPIVADSGERALELARDAPPDVILLDIAMPGMDGRDVCRRLKADPRTRDIPVIFATAANDEHDEAAGFALGAADYVTKPFRPEALRARVRAQLQSRRSWLHLREHHQRLQERVRERSHALEAEAVARRQAETQLARQLFHDPFTELPNRLQLQRSMAGMVERRAPFAVMLLSLLNFHEINNTLGYETGNRLLRQLIARIGAWAEQWPSIAALGGEARVAVLSGVNFAILIDDDYRPERLLAAARSLLETLDRPVDFEGMALSAAAAVGVAHWPRHGLEVDSVLRHAHVAVEEATATDRRVVLYSEAINRYSARRLSLMGELRRAIAEDQLDLVFQPQLSLRDERVVGAEALLRWRHPLLGSVGPDEFVPLAESTGVIRPLTRWVLRAAVARGRMFADAGTPLTVSVNLSARNLRETDLADHVFALLSEYALPPERLALEVTETAVMQSPEQALRMLARLRDGGVASSIDDFGSGYTSLAHLRRLPVSELKIDRSFIQSIPRERSDVLLTQAIIDMGHRLGLRVVAEGIEDRAARDALRRMGCDVGQGYHIGRPQSVDRLLRWLRERPT